MHYEGTQFPNDSILVTSILNNINKCKKKKKFKKDKIMLFTVTLIK